MRQNFGSMDYKETYYMLLIDSLLNIPTELVFRMILHPFYKTGFNKQLSISKKQKFFLMHFTSRIVCKMERFCYLFQTLF